MVDDPTVYFGTFFAGESLILNCALANFIIILLYESYFSYNLCT